MESLAVASLLGFLALIVGTVSLAADSRSQAMGRAAFAQDGATIEVASRADDPAFDSVFRIRMDSTITYGLVLTFRSPRESAIVAAAFSSRGALLELRLLGSTGPRPAPNSQILLNSFPGASEALARASDTVRGASAAFMEGKS
jgi:hypothetical protein